MVWLALLCVLLPQAPPSPNLDGGRRLFLRHCAGCHGPDGDGGKGANLAVPRLTHAPDDAGLVAVIRSGIPGTEMPFTRMTDAEARDLAAFVRALGRRPETRLPGDAARGERLFWAAPANCGGCHTAGDRGGRFGPDLTDVGARRSAAYLRTSLVDPEAAVPDNFTVYRRVVAIPDNFLEVRVATRDGRKISGVRVNEDAFSIQLRDASDEIHSFWKDELADLQKRWGRSSMPSYRDLPAADLDDLVAYLASLRGAR
jgi:putative heme-binding domain-containing protein